MSAKDNPSLQARWYCDGRRLIVWKADPDERSAFHSPVSDYDGMQPIVVNDTDVRQHVTHAHNCYLKMIKLFNMQDWSQKEIEDALHKLLVMKGFSKEEAQCVEKEPRP